MAVLESATKTPEKTPRRHNDVEFENARTRTRMATAVAPTCSVPPISTFRQIRRISVSENSSPTVKSSSTIPISASMSTSSCVLTIPIPAGPATAPATMNETMGGIRMRLSTRMKTSAIA